MICRLTIQRRCVHITTATRLLTHNAHTTRCLMCRAVARQPLPAAPRAVACQPARRGDDGIDTSQVRTLCACPARSACAAQLRLLLGHGARPHAQEPAEAAGSAAGGRAAARAAACTREGHGVGSGSVRGCPRPHGTVAAAGVLALVAGCDSAMQVSAYPLTAHVAKALCKGHLPLP